MGLCSRCGREVYPLYSMPTQVSKVTHRLKHIKWVCRDCMTPKEKWLLVLRNYNLQQYAEKKPTIVVEEFKWAEETAMRFNCPLRRNPLDCDGHSCPSKPKPRCHYELCNLDPKTCGGPNAGCYDDYRNECSQFLEAHRTLQEVLRGKLQVVGKWKAEI